MICFLIVNIKFYIFNLDQNKDGQINRKDMIRIIEAMYDLANEEDRAGDKSPDKRVDLIMQRLNKDKSGKNFLFYSISNFI
jgi:Ca2+-binding EF-hand superfamily protein